MPPARASYKEKLPAIRQWLVAVARSGNKVTYGDVMNVFDVDRFSLRHAMDRLGHESQSLNEPIITALIVGKKSQRCSEGLAKEFGIVDDEQERKHLYEFWRQSDNSAEPPAQDASSSLDVKAARFASVAARPEQAAFRRKVFVACNGRCVISGCDIERALDAAHKRGRDWRLGHNHAQDGILLRKDLHALYDAKLLDISSDGVVELTAAAMEHYGQFSAVRIETPG